MSGPSVVVERAPDGWTHIGGPGMHLLIGLDEDDERTLTASDAADGGDLDDVIEVLTSGGMRNAQHFVGVHWEPATRVVAFGPVAAAVTLADGSVHEVRAMSGKVWTDLELPEHPERVVLRVLDETEANDPVPPQLLAASLGGVTPAAAHSPYAAQPVPDPDASPLVVQPDSEPALTPAGQVAAPSGPDLQRASGTTADPAAPDVAAAETAVADTGTALGGSDAEAGAGGVGSASREFGQRGLPTFGTPSEARAAGSVWGRSWARPVETPDASPVTPEDGDTAVGSRLRSWASASPAVPVRAARPDLRPADSSRPQDDGAPGGTGAAQGPTPVPAHEIPSVPSVRVDGPGDVESTWAARPAAEPEPAAPSYDYLFGHTVAVDEHRRVLAELSRERGLRDEDASDATDGDGTAAGAPGDSGRATVPEAVGAASPAVPGIPGAEAGAAPEEANPPIASGTSPAVVADPPIRLRPSSDPPPAPSSQPSSAAGGLISSVPWATSGSPSPAPDPTIAAAYTQAPLAPTPATSAATPATSAATQPPTGMPAPPEPEADVPSFAGRHTPPPTPSLPPPSITPPPTAIPPAQVSRVPAQPHQPEPEATDAATDSVAVSDGEDAAGDDAELTVDRSALLAARQAVMGEPFSGPAVLAFLCSAGHPTPPHGERCRVCGGSIPPQEAFTMPRPPLGVLRLSTGDVVTLDRSVLLGRAPKLGEGLAATDRPHVVKVPSPERDVSRNHVEVILEGWHVLIRDLATTNGTTVTLPGDGPVRLRANDQQVLEPGSVVSLADEVYFTFEAAP